MSKAVQPQSHRDTDVERRPLAECTPRGGGLTDRVVRRAIELHRRLGPGLQEPIYEPGLPVQSGRGAIRSHPPFAISVNYRGKVLTAHELDFLVENCVVGELRCVDGLIRSFEALVLSYLSITIGLRCDFNSRLLSEGIQRFILCNLSARLRVFVADFFHRC